MNQYVQQGHFSLESVDNENGNVLFFSTLDGACLLMFWLDALAILEHLAKTSEDKFQLKLKRREHYHYHSSILIDLFVYIID